MITNYKYILLIFTIIICVNAIADRENVLSNNVITVSNVALMQKAERGSTAAVLELGNSRDQTLIPKLSQMLKEAKDKKSILFTSEH
ncbi:MAG: hypothetical protein L6437_10695 [Kiritimatiellae bacterium]|nr:hypothetical protein [Kiritimatiellia bacterium]